MSSFRNTAAALVGLVVLLGSAVALAQPARLVEKSGSGEKGYGYEFSDDPLSASGFGPMGATVRVRPGPVRRTLIKPRMSFVDQMLKSVENI